MIRKPWATVRHGRSSRSYICRLAARTLLSSLSLRQLNHILPESSAEVAYLAFCKQKSMEAAVLSFPRGAKGYWIGDSSAEDVIVYIPGMLSSMELIPS